MQRNLTSWTPACLCDSVICLYLHVVNAAVHCYFCLSSHVLINFLFFAALGLCCFAWAFSSRGERELLFIAMRGLLIVVLLLCTGSRHTGISSSCRIFGSVVTAGEFQGT